VLVQAVQQKEKQLVMRRVPELVLVGNNTKLLHRIHLVLQ
jgi:hypothetical protein